MDVIGLEACSTGKWVKTCLEGCGADAGVHSLFNSF